MDPPTVIALKQAFLELATRQLAQQLAPSRAWQRKNDLREGGHGIGAAINAVTATDGSGEDTGRRLPPKIVDDVLARVNQLLLLHARRVHPPAAVRHVAEQLDQLYQTVGDQLATAAPNESSNEALDRGLDYTTTSAIVGLPTTWDDLQESDALPLEARRYAEQVSELRSLAERRTTITARTRQLQEVAMALENVASSDNPPQHSLVTRDAKKQAIASGAGGAPKKFTRVTKAPRSAKAVKAHASTGKIMKTFSSGLAAKTEAMLGDRAGHLELIGPGKKKGVDRKSDKAHQAGSRRFG
ncbi:hypothetical protein SCUCBS95973_009089 [Sporothrix curviconia]|uniref:Kinetochore protein n=1 Tax=Sporothrix curviconia TaxID=1260050 RepID=A0ABP0CUN0_9PEZI